MVDVSCEAEIGRSAADVFAYTSLVTNDPVWTGGLVEVRPIGDPHLVPGGAFERVSRFLGRQLVYRIEVREVEPGRRVVMETSSGPFPMRIVYETEPLGPSRCRFRIRASGEPGGFFAFAAPVVSAATRRSIQRDVDTLRDVLEGQA
ncbi:MAG: SRPBCC family protein [Alphaproteobacteria bacterium]|nr:SRPBCC family protein [Alphaproteobacteria bacterium]